MVIFKVLSRPLHDQRGMTLIEIIVVLIILSIVIGFLTNSIFSTADKAKCDLNGLQMKKIKGDINMYRLRYNSLPGNLEELTHCSDRTGPGCSVITTDDALRDVWGNPYKYTLEGNGRTFQLTTTGSDGVAGGADDCDVVLKGP